MEDQADIGLIAACQHGDARSFRQLFEIYRDRVYALCRHMAGNDADAQDLAQESFVWAFKNIGSFRAESAFGTWLYRIAVNRCRAEFRKQRHRFQSVDLDEKSMATALTAGPNPDELLVRKELAERTEVAVAALPETLRMTFVLGAQMGMRYRDVAEVLGCSEDAVKVRMHRARKRVRDALRPYLEN